ncbi:MAG: hypothetical protein HFH93_15305 [Lachnospiraceae bacterium]|nr:hypothetical protein [Lachnospiraceae bacterium]
MLEEQRKLVRIIAELTMFFLEIGAEHISSNVDREGAEERISFRADYRPGCEDKLKEMQKCLSEQRNDGIEDIYWELAGSGNHGQTTQLMLVGMMIDRAEVSIGDGFVELTLHKKPRE